VAHGLGEAARNVVIFKDHRELGQGRISNPYGTAQYDRRFPGARRAKW
jgi:hypothetical protein